MNKVKKLSIYLALVEQYVAQTTGPKQDFWKRELRKTKRRIEELTK